MSMMHKSKVPKNRAVQIFLLAVLFLLVMGYAVSVRERDVVPYFRDMPHAEVLPEAAYTAHIRDDFTVDKAFTSHLPIIVIDTHGKEIEVAYTWFSEQGYNIPIPGMEPNVDADIMIIDSGKGINAVGDVPLAVSAASIHRRGRSSMDDAKGSYKVNLLTESGQENKVELLGMESSDEWALVASMHDMSLMRNFLAYTVIADILPYTPQIRYCEVLLKAGDALRYEGVYMLTETIKQGAGRIDIADVGNGDIPNSFIVRRDRLKPEGLTLDTYATRKELSSGYLELLYPKNEKATDTVVSYVQESISAIERVIYADDPSLFLTYPDYIDVDSFVDYYVVNEFFTNYDAGNYSTFMYQDLGGKLHMGPVWDFDVALDNQYSYPLLPYTIAFQSAPWFDHLVKDADFMKKLINRYTELRRGILADERMVALIDETASYLTGAQTRDYLRWKAARYVGRLKDFRISNEEIRLRNTMSYSEELIKEKYLLVAHADCLEESLKGFSRVDDVMHPTDNTRRAAYLSAAFIILLSTLAVVARRL
jgi:spore coat protein CotH